MPHPKGYAKLRSMASNENLFQIVMDSIHGGENDRARDLLSRLIKNEPQNAQYWLWMSAVVETRREQIYCLKEAHRLDPKNNAVRRGLILLGELEVDEKLVIPLRAQRRTWQTPHTHKTNSILDKLVVAPTWMQISLALGGGLIVIGLIYLLISQVSGRVAMLFQPKPTPTWSLLSIMYTPTVGTPQPTLPLTKSTPLGAVLSSTYTPTPLYVNTPHPSSEDYRNALTAMGRKDWNSALNYLQAASELEPDSADLYYQIGEVYLALGSTHNAQASFGRALQKSGAFAPAYLGIAQVKLTAEPDAYDSIRDSIEQSIAFDANNPGCLSVDGRT